MTTQPGSLPTQRPASWKAPKLVTVWCSQFASCGWSGKRLSSHVGVQPKPCPRCGKEVTR